MIMFKKKAHMNTFKLFFLWSMLLCFNCSKESSTPTVSTGNDPVCDITPLIDTFGCQIENSCLVSISNLKTGFYKSFQGGLYPGGVNERPQNHTNKGIAIANSLKPLDDEGNVNELDGKIVMASIGVSNTSIEFTPFIDLASNAVNTNAKLVIVNGAVGGNDLVKWVNNSDNDSIAPYSVFNNRLFEAHVTAKQVQVLWIKHAFADNPEKGDFPVHAQLFQDYLKQLIHILYEKMPNLKLVYLSSRTRAYTYELRKNSPEPYAYELGFGVKWLVEEQINGNPELNFDPILGAVKAPWISWGPYIWANDESSPNPDGFFWECQDTRSVDEFDDQGMLTNTADFMHPSKAYGAPKIGAALYGFFTSDPTSTPWFLE